jgi:hypothetical protein
MPETTLLGRFADVGTAIGSHYYSWIGGFLLWLVPFIINKWGANNRFGKQLTSVSRWIKSNRVLTACNIFLLTILVASFLAIDDKNHQLRVALESEPAVTIEAGGVEDYLFPPEKRPKGFNDWAVKLDVNTTLRLDDARVSVFKVHRRDETGEFKTLTFVHAPIARWNWGEEGKTPFNPVDVFKTEPYALFEGTPDGKHIVLLTSAKEPELRDLKTDMPPGEYKFELVVSAKNLKRPAEATILVKWPGDMRNFRMEVIRPLAGSR